MSVDSDAGHTHAAVLMGKDGSMPIALSNTEESTQREDLEP